MAKGGPFGTALSNPSLRGVWVAMPSDEFPEAHDVKVGHYLRNFKQQITHDEISKEFTRG